MLVFTHDGIQFNYRDEGKGTPFIFQHGLSGDVNQTHEFFQGTGGKIARPIRVITLDCRAHGETRPLGPEEKIGIASFADDVLALIEYLRIERPVVGGISMGAAVALNFALRYPTRLRALVLSRPAWLDAPLPDNLKVFPLIAGLIREHGAARGKEIFLSTPELASIRQESEETAQSLLGQFDDPRAEEAVVRLERIPRDAPCESREQWKAIHVPALVLVNKKDPIHPSDFGEELARRIPDCELREITPKSVSVEQHYHDVRNHIEYFVSRLG